MEAGRWEAFVSIKLVRYVGRMKIQDPIVERRIGKIVKVLKSQFQDIYIHFVSAFTLFIIISSIYNYMKMMRNIYSNHSLFSEANSGSETCLHSFAK